MTLLQIGGAERLVGHAGEQGIGPGLEQLLTVARKLELPLELLMGKARTGQIHVGLRHAPISERCRRQRHGKQQSRGDEELGLITHRMSQSDARPEGEKRSIIPPRGQ